MTSKSEFLASFQQSLSQKDSDISSIFQKELSRQELGLELIASENYVSQAVLEAQGSILTNKYAEGYPSKRYYGGCVYVDEAENLAQQRLCELFQAEAANVQPHSGSQANMAVLMTLLNPGDKFLGMDLTQGGHLTHGSPVNFSGKLFQALSYGLHPETDRLDYDQIRELVKKERPKLLIAGASAYSRIIDFEKLGSIAQEFEIPLMADIAHIAGLVAAHLHPSPIPYATYTTSTTHKTLRGPRGGIIMCRQKDLKAVNSTIFPGIQGGPFMHVIAAKAVAFGEALHPQFKEYQKQVLKNAQVLAESLLEKGYHLVSGGTDNHLMLLDLSQSKAFSGISELSGKDAEKWLDEAGITVNKNSVPREKRSPFITSGIRIGVPAITTRFMKEPEMKLIAGWIDQALKTQGDLVQLQTIRKEVETLCKSFPIYSPL